MTPSNRINVIVAICFVVFICLADTCLHYYAAMLSKSARKKVVLIMKLSDSPHGFCQYIGDFSKLEGRIVSFHV